MELKNYEKWPITDFSGGMNQKAEANLLPPNQAEDVQNCIVTTIGRLKKRPGCAKLNSVDLGGAVQGLHGYHYGTGLTNHRLVAAANGVVAYWNTGTSAFVNIATGLSTTAQMLFETCATYMVYMNGVNAPRKWDGTTDSALANAPATGKCPVLFKEKLFCIADANTVKWSENFKPETWLSVNYYEIDKGDGDELSALFRNNRELLICKKRRIFNLRGTSLDDFNSDCIESKHGVAGPRAGIVLEPYFYYISEDGIFRWNGIESLCLTDPPAGSNMPGIDVLWGTVNKAALDKAVAGYNPTYDQLWFCVPEGASTTNNMILVYDRTYGSWWVFRGIPVSSLINYNDGSTIKLYAGHSSAGWVMEQNTGFNDIGAAISSYWVGSNFDGGDPEVLKRFRVSALTDVSGLNDAVFNYRIDGAAYVAPTAVKDQDNFRYYDILNGRGHYFQPKLTHSVIDQDFCCSGIKTWWKPLL